MIKFTKILFYLLFILSLSELAHTKENFFNEGVKLFKNKKFDDAKFSFERSIVFNPKHANSYLYLAKIYKEKEDQKKEEKNLETTLLIDPKNEEAILMLMEIGIKKLITLKSKSYLRGLQKFVKIYVMRTKRFYRT